MNDALLRAYLATDYSVETRPRIIIHVGVRSDALDAQLRLAGVTTWAYVAAVNPGSVLLRPHENEMRRAALIQRVAAEGYVFVDGQATSRDPQSFEPEPSLWVLGISEGDASALGREFGQYAVLVGQIGEAPRLVACNPTVAQSPLATAAIHAGEIHPKVQRAAITPIFQSVVYEHEETGDDKTVLYPRYGNLPNHDVVHARIATLEQADDAHVVASGMAAVTAAILASTRHGGRILMQRDLYGGTHAFAIHDLPAMGRSVTFVDAHDVAGFEKAMGPDVQAIYVEAMSNPLSRVIDHEQVVAFARRNKLTSIIDSTFAPPVLWQPAKVGFDLVVHSATKFLNGHSDLTAGVVAGRRELMGKVRSLARRLGGSLDGLNVWLLERGMKTLPLRVERACDNALRVAMALASHPNVTRVFHTGMPSHPDFDLARRYFGGRSALLAFEVRGGGSAAAQCLERLRLIVHGPSLGGVETLAVRPVTTSHRGVPIAERESMGITDGLIRLAVGIECADDIVKDLTNALDAS